MICRKCCNLVETFFHYKKSVAEGQVSLKKQVEEYKEKKAAIAEFKKKEAEEVFHQHPDFSQIPKLVVYFKKGASRYHRISFWLSRPLSLTPSLWHDVTFL